MKTTLFLLLALLISAQSFAENEILAEEDAVPAERGIGGWIDLRPGWHPSEGQVNAENEAAVEVRLNPTLSMGYTQEFQLQLDVADAAGGTSNKLLLDDGYLWAEFADIVKFSKSLTLSYQPRLYLPTEMLDKERGMIVTTRQYLKLNLKVSRVLDIFLSEIPILAFHNMAGWEIDGDVYANRVFENRVEFGPQLTLFNEKLTIRVPIILQSLKHRDFDVTALHNAQWTHLLWIYPEALFQVAEKTSVGVAYYSDTLIGDDFRSVDVKDGLKNGLVQAVFQQTL